MERVCFAIYSSRADHSPTSLLLFPFLLPVRLPVCRPTLNNYVATQEEFDTYTRELFDLIEKGIVRIAVHKEYPFSVEGIRQAQEDLTSRKTTGKLIVKVA